MEFSGEHTQGSPFLVNCNFFKKSFQKEQFYVVFFRIFLYQHKPIQDGRRNEAKYPLPGFVQ